MGTVQLRCERGQPPHDHFGPPTSTLFQEGLSRLSVLDNRAPSLSPPPGLASPTTSAPHNYVTAPFWTHFNTDPYSEIETDPHTGMIRPWYAV